MATSFEKYQKRRLISSYFSVVISISLVLFLLGLLGLFVINSNQLSRYFKEQIPLSIYLKDNAKEVEINQLKQSLEMAEYTKSATYVSKEEAAEQHSEAIGEDYLEFLGYNPLQNSIDVELLAEFVSSDKLKEIANEISAKDFVEEVEYDEVLVELFDKNIKVISFWVLVFSALFLVIAVLLINSSIRLSVYSKRFTIKTMQMVGATKRFIRRPFIWKSMRLGILGSFLAMIGVAAVLFFLDKEWPQLGLMDNTVLVAGLFVFLLVVGVVITWISTFFATQRFLNLRTDELYY
ncbi:permease-like cell division protein FtsX [Aureisphaera galaxeae]|uniref:cell division protein FtsX n=1 Tax=Aureisphaera galaxeae TaxID=1538023 RepID=UPI002350251E|nr:permease-like cell division protein FtsX [Aureisphaera galaxeae]MDC8002775.1 permease-like cell division protein FtsX [Aureisphaera galaxeae]